jgi:thymidylate kinase
MKVISIEGVHGVGKSSIINEFKKKGYVVLPEKFMSQCIPFLSKVSMYAQVLNLITWFGDVLDHKRRGCKLLITDRSPHTGLIYSKEEGLVPIIERIFTELKEVGIEVITINIICDRLIHWDRINKRLLEEPERSEYNEHDQAWFEYIIDRYGKYTWNHTVDNTGGMEHTVGLIDDIISNKTST